MSLMQSCFSVRQAEAGLCSSLKKEAVGSRPASADRVRGQSGLRPGRRRMGHGSRFTAEKVRSVPSPSAPERALTLGVVGSTNEAATVTVGGQPATTAADNSFKGTVTPQSGTTTFSVVATDGSGNTRTSTFQVTGVTGSAATLSYDENGNLTQKVEGADTWAYTWDAENRLKEVKKNAVTQATFRYDPSDRRVEKVAGGTTFRYVYDNEDWIRRTGGTTMDILHGPGIDEPLSQDVGGTLTYFHADALGSVQKHTNTAGAVTATIQYDAWGNALVGTPGPYGFTGREPDAETGLHYYRARYYDSKLGRFLNEDPIGLHGGIDLYAYVGNDPIKHVDPSGNSRARCWADYAACLGAAYAAQFVCGTLCMLACARTIPGGMANPLHLLCVGVCVFSCIVVFARLYWNRCVRGFVECMAKEDYPNPPAQSTVCNPGGSGPPGPQQPS